jgi:hypothetical protein
LQGSSGPKNTLKAAAKSLNLELGEFEVKVPADLDTAMRSAKIGVFQVGLPSRLQNRLRMRRTCIICPSVNSHKEIALAAIYACVREASFIAQWLILVEDRPPLGVIANRKLNSEGWHLLSSSLHIPGVCRPRARIIVSFVSFEKFDARCFWTFATISASSGHASAPARLLPTVELRYYPT